VTASPVRYIPIATTIVAAFFATIVLRRYSVKGDQHLLWWEIGMVTYGIGTLTESTCALLLPAVTRTKLTHPCASS
jgi:hypothetical protein